MGAEKPVLDKSRPPFEETAIQAVNEAVRQAKLLHDSWDDISKAARYLEKLQIAAAQAERAAFMCHTPAAQQSLHLANQIVTEGRELFHKMKENRKKP